MSRAFATWALSIVLIAGSGCAVRSYDYGLDAPHAPDAHPDGLAEITVVRRSAYGLLLPMDVSVNGHPLPTLWSRTYVSRTVEPGPVEVTAYGEVPCWLRFEAEADQSYVVIAVPRTGWWSMRVQLETGHPADDWTRGCRALP